MRVALLVALGIAASAGIARGDAKNEAKALFTEGRALYDAGQFDKAALKFKAAHAKDPDPVYLFNAGQALRFAKQCEEAVTFYERFLADMPDPPNKDAVDGYLGEARACAKERKPIEPPPPPPKKVVEKPSRAPAYVATGVAVASIATGVFLSTRVLRHQAEYDRIHDGCSVSDPCSSGDLQKEEDAGNKAAKLSFVAYGIGGAVAVGAVLLWMRKPKAREAQVTVVPTGDGVMAASAWRF